MFASLCFEVPDAPRDLHVTSRTGSAIHLKWTAPAANGGCPILGYIVFGGTDANALAAVGTTPSSVHTTFLYAAGAANTDFYFKVQAKNWKSEQNAAFVVAKTANTCSTKTIIYLSLSRFLSRCIS